MLRRAAVALASAALVAAGTMAAPAVSATPTAPAKPAATARCVVKPIIPAVVVIGAPPVRRVFTIQTNCRLKAPLTFIANLVDDRYTFSVGVTFKGTHGVINDGATAVFRHNAGRLAYGHFRISPTTVHVVGRPGLRAKSARTNFALKYETWTTATPSAEDEGHYFYGKVTIFVGVGQREAAVYPVLIQWRKGNRWVTAEKTTSLGGVIDVALPMTGNRVDRAVAIPYQSYVQRSASKPVLCSGAERPGGGC